MGPGDILFAPKLAVTLDRAELTTGNCMSYRAFTHIRTEANHKDRAALAQQAIEELWMTPRCHVRVCVEGNKGFIVAMEDLAYATWRAILTKTVSATQAARTPQ